MLESVVRLEKSSDRTGKSSRSFPENRIAAIRCQAVVSSRVKLPPSGDRWLRPGNQRNPRGARVASIRSVGSTSSNPSPCWLPLDTGVQRLHLFALVAEEQGTTEHTEHTEAWKHGSTVGGFVSVCSACSVVKNGIATQAQDHLPDRVGLTIDSVRVCGNQSKGSSYFSKERKLRRLGTSQPLSISNTSLSISSIMELAIGGLSSGPEKSHQNRIGRSR